MKFYSVINNANSVCKGMFTSKENAQALADKLNDEAIDRRNFQIHHFVEEIEYEYTAKQLLEQALINYAINECDGNAVANILGVEANDIQGLLQDFQQEWEDADEPSDADAVIDKYVALLTYDGEVEDVTLTKGGYGHDLLEWSYMGKQYQCEGEFKVTERGNLYHTFIAPNGKEIEIVTNYYPESEND